MNDMVSNAADTVRSAVLQQLSQHHSAGASSSTSDAVVPAFHPARDVRELGLCVLAEQLSLAQVASYRSSPEWGGFLFLAGSILATDGEHRAVVAPHYTQEELALILAHLQEGGAICNMEAGAAQMKQAMSAELARQKHQQGATAAAPAPTRVRAPVRLTQAQARAAAVVEAQADEREIQIQTLSIAATQARGKLAAGLCYCIWLIHLNRLFELH